MKLCNIKKSHLGVFSSLSLYTKKNRVNFLLKVILASFIAAIGFIMNNQESIIGSMLISPLGGPLMGLIAALLLFDVGSSLTSILYLILAFILMIVIGACIGYFFRNQEPTEEMKKRYSLPDKWTLINAIFVGTVFAIVTLSSGGALVESIGAGIAISLLPPVVNCGVTLTNQTIDIDIRKKNMWNTFLITLVNMLGITISSFVIFSMYCKNKMLFSWE